MNNNTTLVGICILSFERSKTTKLAHSHGSHYSVIENASADNPTAQTEGLGCMLTATFLISFCCLSLERSNKYSRGKPKTMFATVSTWKRCSLSFDLAPRVGHNNRLSRRISVP